MFSTNLGEYQEVVDSALAEIEDQRILSRIWAHDHTVWKSDPTEITNRLGWLKIAEVMIEEISLLEALVEAVRQGDQDGRPCTHVLLLGMGGSSLAPEVFSETYGVEHGYLDLKVLDSTDPGAVLANVEQLDLTRTMFIVSTKSGGTVETLSFFKFFYNRVAEAVGVEQAGNHFIAITDAGSQLDELAARHNFRAIFRNDPNIGGRYSVLSYFGLVPAALVGVDVETLLERALAMAGDNQGYNGPVDGDNYGARLGVILGELAKAGRDKVTLITSPAIASFGDWVEQLLAESTGKEGKGILPVVGEPVGAPEVYRDDRLFVYLRLDGDNTFDAAVNDLEDAGHPVVRLRLKDIYDLGGQFFLWEMATVVAGHRLDINPFDQPNVESAKVLALQMVTAFHEKGELPVLAPTLRSDGITVYGDLQEDLIHDLDVITAGDALRAFFDQAQLGDYVTLQAYLKPNVGTDRALSELRAGLRARTRLATTLGYGPRFLHSTGQLHKGDAGGGLFIQITADSPQDADIPDEAGSPESSISFGALKAAQALGDRQALLDVHRRVIRFHLGSDVAGGLDTLIAALA